MSDILYHRIQPEDTALLSLLSEWYNTEWNMDKITTIQRFIDFPETGIPFHLAMTLDGKPIAAGGLANHVSILTHVPRLKIYQPWLSLVYTTPENQKKGYGTMLCHKIEALAKELGIKEYFLFTYTAEKLYIKLGWEVMERLLVNDKNMVVMKKIIAS